MSDREFDGISDHFQLIESQVQFGDSKASLLVAGNAILLAICGSFIKLLSGCNSSNFSFDCLEPTASLLLVSISGFCILASVTFALFAALPGKIHLQPPEQLYLLSYIATLKSDEFISKYMSTSHDEFYIQALKAIHGKSVFATRKFKLLRFSIYSTLWGIALLALAFLIEVSSVVVKHVCA